MKMSKIHILGSKNRSDTIFGNYFANHHGKNEFEIVFVSQSYRKEKQVDAISIILIQSLLFLIQKLKLYKKKTQQLNGCHMKKQKGDCFISDQLRYRS